jgi:hypothetical protein
VLANKVHDAKHPAKITSYERKKGRIERRNARDEYGGNNDQQIHNHHLPLGVPIKFVHIRAADAS